MASLRRKFERHAEGRATLSFDPLDSSQPTFAYLPINQIATDPAQPRKVVGSLEELKASIQEHGILQPIIVSPIHTDSYQIVVGERRFTAAKELQLATVPAIVRTIEEHQRLEVQLIENIHRKDLNPIEEATAYQRLIDEFKLSQRQLAERLGKSATSINEALRVLSLPAIILEGVGPRGTLSRSVLLEIAKLPSPEDQLAVWRQATNETLTVKGARAKKSGKCPPPRHHSKFPLRTLGALVTVVFDREHVRPGEIVEALAEALMNARKEGTACQS